jgi:arylsulfatase
MRWPGKIKAGWISNEIIGLQDMLPTLLAMAGDPDVTAKLLNGYKVGDKTFNVHIDGLNMLPYLTGQVEKSPRESFFYISDDGGVMAIRHGDWKLVLEEQRAERMKVWSEPLVNLRLPLMFNLRRDPFERSQHNSNSYYEFVFDHVFLIYGMMAIVQAQIDDYVKYPPRQKPTSYNLDEVMAKLNAGVEAAPASKAEKGPKAA